MTIDNWLKISIDKLKSASVPTATLDAEVLLADYLDKDRSWIHAHPDFNLPLISARPDPAEQGRTLQKLNGQIERRMSHEPLAYIRGIQEFYGREFIVSPDTLTPRPETETMIEMLLAIQPLHIIDIGTGSGCIAITANLELPKAEVSACDISLACLDIAKQNAIHLKSNVNFYKSDLLQDMNIKTIAKSVLCCNLPYVPDDFKINTAATHEPKIALFGGPDGIDYYRQLFEQIISLPEQFKPLHVFIESLPPQHEDLEIIAEQANYRLMSEVDLIQHFMYDDLDT